MRKGETGERYVCGRAGGGRGLRFIENLTLALKFFCEAT